MKHPPTHRILAPLVAACLGLLALSANAATHDLSKFDPGSHVAGPKASGKHIKGKVVVVKYWGITCGPCLKAIPHTTELAKKYGHDKLIIIANQSWSAADRQAKDTWNKYAKNDMVMVVNGGKLPGFRPSSVPRALIFDHTGKSVWEGHPGNMDSALADAIANIPEPEEQEEPQDETEKEDAGPAPIVTDLEPAHFKKEVRLINEQQRSIAPILAKLRRAVERLTREEQKGEAQAIVDAVQAWAQEQQAQAQAAKEEDPATTYALSQAAIKLLGKDELAQGMRDLVEEIEKDETLLEQVRATLSLRDVVALAKSIGLDEDPDVAKDRKQASTIRLITRDLSRIIKAYPDTDTAEQAKQLRKDWGLNG